MQKHTHPPVGSDAAGPTITSITTDRDDRAHRQRSRRGRRGRRRTIRNTPSDMTSALRTAYPTVPR